MPSGCCCWGTSCVCGIQVSKPRNPHQWCICNVASVSYTLYTCGCFGGSSNHDDFDNRFKKVWSFQNYFLHGYQKRTSFTAGKAPNKHAVWTTGRFSIMKYECLVLYMRMCMECHALFLLNIGYTWCCPCHIPSDINHRNRTQQWAACRCICFSREAPLLRTSL